MTWIFLVGKGIPVKYWRGVCAREKSGDGGVDEVPNVDCISICHH